MKITLAPKTSLPLGRNSYGKETYYREGWYLGRKDYWEKHLDSVKEQLNKVIEEE